MAVETLINLDRRFSKGNVRHVEANLERQIDQSVSLRDNCDLDEVDLEVVLNRSSMEYSVIQWCAVFKTPK